MLFPICVIVTIFTVILLKLAPVRRRGPSGTSNFGTYFSLLKGPFVLLSFVKVVYRINVSINAGAATPGVLVRHLSVALTRTNFTADLCFVFHAINYFLKTFVLRGTSTGSFFTLDIIFVLLTVIKLFVFRSRAVVCVYVTVVNFNGSGIFSVVFSRTLFTVPRGGGRISKLVVVKLFNNAMFPLTVKITNSTVKRDNTITIVAIKIVCLLVCALGVGG